MIRGSVLRVPRQDDPDSGPEPSAAPIPVLAQLQAVSKSYRSDYWWGRNAGRENRVLDGVSLDIHDSELLGLVGRSGTGKSTLARILAWMEKPDRGSVLYRGNTWEPGRIPPGIRRQVQYVFQNPASSLNPRMTVWRQLTEAPLHHRLGPSAEIRDRIRHVISLLGLEGSSLDRYPHQFSGGQQQRLALARALSVEPRLLICDEVTSSLDRQNAAELVLLLQGIHREMGVAVVFVSHDLALARQFCQRILRLSNGNLEPLTWFNGPQLRRRLSL